MKKNFIKCIISLGLLLFFTLLIPLTPFGSSTAQAASIDKEKDDYRLNLKSIVLVKGKSFTLRAYNLGENAKVYFKSDDPEVASVNEDGGITANKVGVANITATIKDGINSNSLTCEVTVGPPALSVKFTRSRIILGKDNVDLLKVILKPSNTAEDARFSSYNSSIVSVSTGGRVTAKELGFTYLFAEIDATNPDGNRKFAVCTVIVTKPEDASSLETYFNNHPELDLITEDKLTAALEEFFNGKSVETSPKAENVKTSLVDSLNRFLDAKFDLKTLRDSVTNNVSN